MYSKYNKKVHYYSNFKFNAIHVIEMEKWLFNNFGTVLESGKRGRNYNKLSACTLFLLKAKKNLSYFLEYTFLMDSEMAIFAIKSG